ncbi:MAG: chromate transporter [Bacteroidales bacterium]|nr:chromate transporter [Bacteroidales bacterium]
MTAIFLQLFWTFFVIGLFNFGGGGAMISLIQSRVVTDLGWISQAQFTDIVAISQTTPGPIGINCATYVGYEVGCHAGTLISAPGALAASSGSVALGIAGSALATLALVLPSFIIFWGIVALYKKYRSTPLFGNVMSGLRPVVAGLIGAAALLLMFRFSGSALPGSIGLDVSVLTENFADWTSWAILAATVAASFIFKVNPIILIVLGGILGLIIY